ncbi:D-alanyl-D-alanine dipeptidase, partial [Agrobacterium tumefaciens]
PPLPCRASPPQGGRSARRPRIASIATVENYVGDRVDSISPLEGEMPGRAEGGKPHPPR